MKTLSKMSPFAGKEGSPNMVAYFAAKAGVITLSLAKALGAPKKRINVNSVATAAALTPEVLKGLPDSRIEDPARRISVRRFGRQEETTVLVSLLTSEETSFITGIAFNTAWPMPCLERAASFITLTNP